MNTINVELAANAYPVYLGHGLLTDSSLWQRHLGDGKTLIVSNDVVAPLYLESLKAALTGQQPETCIIPDGEPFKTPETWYGIIDKLVSMQARRDVNVIALGGGVVGDITGFAAASYMRGVRFIQAPTTLLAQVDASVGGKTGFQPRKREKPGRCFSPTGCRYHRFGHAGNPQRKRVQSRPCRSRKIRRNT